MGYFVGKDRMLFSWNLFFCKDRAKHFVWIKAHTAQQEFADLYTAVFRIKRPDAAKTKCLEIPCPVMTLDTTFEEIMRLTKDSAGIDHNVMKDYFVSKCTGYSSWLGYNWEVILSCVVRIKQEKKI